MDVLVCVPVFGVHPASMPFSAPQCPASGCWIVDGRQNLIIIHTYIHYIRPWLQATPQYNHVLHNYTNVCCIVQFLDRTTIDEFEAKLTIYRRLKILSININLHQKLSYPVH